MNAMHASQPNRALLVRQPSSCLVFIAIALFICVGGCSGSAGNSNNGGPGGPPDPTDPPTGNTTLTLTARDVFGAPVPGADVIVLVPRGTGFRELSTPTDADGRVEVVGDFEDVYAALVSATELAGTSYEPTRPADDRIAFVVTLHPASGLTPGVSNLSVTSQSADGRHLEFSARLHVVEGDATGDFESWNFGAVSVRPCEPDAVAECVEGSAGFDASYVGFTLTQSWVDPHPASDAWAISVLLDQGSSVAVTDPADRRLLAARYLQTQLRAHDRMALAAFAANDAGTGDVALLPTQPVTIFPVDNPAFANEGFDWFPTINSLATLEGGGSPLHAAMEELISFTASYAPADSRRAVAVLASGGANDCDTAADCQAAQDALGEQIAAADVAVVAVGLSNPSRQVDRKKLGTLAQFEQGAVFWAQDATQVPTVFGRLPEILDGRHGAIDVTIRLASPIAGAFASGHTVVGTFHIVMCPWDCNGLIDVPFALRVP
jgi:hypothetical protein